MYGICGIVYPSREHRVEKEHLLSIVRTKGVGGGKIYTATFGNAGLGAQAYQGRLAGIAESTISSRSVGLAFHGTINQELSLESRIAQDPLSKLLELYLQNGTGFFNHIRGQFVLAIWDGRDEILSLATDRFRVHPMYYYQDRESFIFSSNLKGILFCPLSIDATINPEAIVNVVGNSIIPTPDTIFKEIKKVPAGHVLRYRNGDVKLDPYWEVSFCNPSRESESVLAEKLKNQFQESLSVYLNVEKDLGHIGTYLSGGVDSSTVTGVLTQLLKTPVKTFSIGFGEEKYNEINYARFAAETFQCRHHEYFVTPEDTYRVLPSLVEIFDEPYANASAIPAYFCAKLAKENSVDVLYAGDGGDEIFAGNERYSDMRRFDYYGEIPALLRDSVLKPIVSRLADSLKFEVLVKGKKYIRRAELPYHQRITSYDLFWGISLSEFLEDSFLETVGKDFDPFSKFRLYYFEAPAQCNLDRHLYIDWYLTLSDNDLIKVTRTAEAAGVDIRFPFLDHKLVEFSVTVPAYMKMRGTKLRTFFKNAYADLLPSEIRKKKKHGFGLPIPVWLRTDERLNELMRELVLSPRAIQRGYFKRKFLEDLVKNHKKDTTSFYGTVLWNLMVLELWMRDVHP